MSKVIFSYSIANNLDSDISIIALYRYKQTNDRVGSGIGGRGSAFTNSSELNINIEDGKAPNADRVSIVSGASGDFYGGIRTH
jgi:hypothetical protein